MLTFFSLRGYRCASLENDLRRVATINRLDALRSSEQNDGTVDRVPLVLTNYSFNVQIKRFLLQNFRIISTDQQTRDIFPQPSSVAYKRDLNLRNMLVHSNDDSSTEQYGSRACQSPVDILTRTSALTPRCGVLATLFLSVAISPASPVISCTAYPVSDALPFFTLVKPGGASGVVLANAYVVSATTLLGSLWPNISTSRVTVFQISGCGVCSYAMGQTSSASSVK